MTQSNNNEVLHRLTSSLEVLLGQIKESQAEFATIKAELAVLHDNVKLLSRIVMDGDGNVSVITRVALLEQKIDDVIKWQEYHENWEKETQKRLSRFISDFKEEVEEIQRQVLKMESRVDRHEQQLVRDERAEQAAIDKELELAHAEKINSLEVKAERQKLVLKIAGVVVGIVLTFLAGYLTNQQQHNSTQEQTQQQHVP